MYYGATNGLGRTWSDWLFGERIVPSTAEELDELIEAREEGCERICEEQMQGYVLQSWAILGAGATFLIGYFLARRLE
jgi:hypothetical protein